MISVELRSFVDRVLDAGIVSDADVGLLARDVLCDGAMSAEVVDVLVALDRAVLTHSALWADYLVATVVDFVVWTSRPTGQVTREQARWLMTTLTIGDGPTVNAQRIAFEVVREADRCDDSLVAFAMCRGAVRGPLDFSLSGAALLVA